MSDIPDDRMIPMDTKIEPFDQGAIPECKVTLQMKGVTADQLEKGLEDAHLSRPRRTRGEQGWEVWGLEFVLEPIVEQLRLGNDKLERIAAALERAHPAESEGYKEGMAELRREMEKR